jgi:Gas vesicle protein G
MGLITGLLTLPLAPVRGVAWVTEQIVEEAQSELYDENRIVRELIELDEAHDAGEMDDERYDAAVDDALARLEIGRQLKSEKGASVG